MNKTDSANNLVFEEVRLLIEQSRQQVAIVVNSTISMLYWQIGKRINDEVIKDQRAEYGSQIINLLSIDLVNIYGSSFSEKNLRRMIQFATTFPDKEIVVSMIRQLSWTHILAVIPIADPLKRAFYIEKWSVRTFRNCF